MQYAVLAELAVKDAERLTAIRRGSQNNLIIESHA